ncbi:fragment of Putative Integrase (part 2) [Vibrio nigripulchritudo MADA3020]|nr:fragment of Putative Integrase (part 2) [Vibrio nigripulchritudo MADA3020]
MEEPDVWDKTGRTKKYVIQLLRGCDMSSIERNRLRTSDLITHCTNRRATGAGGTTNYHDIAYLRSVMKKPNIAANYQIFEEAVPVFSDMGLIGKSHKRTRRLTSQELDRLRSGLLKRESFRPNGNTCISFTDILEFSILTCMRIGEVCSIRWQDQDNKTVTVRNRKDPCKKTGNHMLVPLLGESFDIAMNQPHKAECIFLYNSRSVTAGFQRVQNELGIHDLRYHDLRRERASRLFEKGYSIEELAQVTDNKNLNILWQVYAHLFPNKLHEKG